MKVLLTISILLYSCAAYGQDSQKGTDPLTAEWKQEINLPGNDYMRFTDFVRLNEQILVGIATDKGSAVVNIDREKTPQISYTVPLYLTTVYVRQQDYFTKEHCNVKRRSFSHSVIHESCFKMQPDWPAGSTVSAFTDRFLYHAEGDSFLKYDLEGNLVFRKQIGVLVNSQLVSVGGSYIYLFSQISNPGPGARLILFDTLGNQNWSKEVGDVRAIVADEQGNCFISTADGESTISKIDSDGKTVWSTLVSGQHVRGMSIKGDSVFVCGHISQNGATSNLQRSCYSIILASTGALISQQVLDVYENPKEREYFDVITADGKNIYLGGAHGFESERSCFLLKLSPEGQTAGLQDEKSGKSSYSIFPNPGANKFTISCEEANTGVLEITVRNSLGQVVQKKEIECKGDKSWELDLGKQATGNYSVEILSGDRKVVKKIVVE